MPPVDLVTVEPPTRLQFALPSTLRCLDRTRAAAIRKSRHHRSNPPPVTTGPHAARGSQQRKHLARRAPGPHVGICQRIGLVQIVRRSSTTAAPERSRLLISWSRTASCTHEAQVRTPVPVAARRWTSPPLLPLGTSPTPRRERPPPQSPHLAQQLRRVGKLLRHDVQGPLTDSRPNCPSWRHRCVPKLNGDLEARRSTRLRCGSAKLFAKLPFFCGQEGCVLSVKRLFAPTAVGPSGKLCRPCLSPGTVRAGPALSIGQIGCPDPRSNTYRTSLLGGAMSRSCRPCACGK